MSESPPTPGELDDVDEHYRRVTALEKGGPSAEVVSQNILWEMRRFVGVDSLAFLSIDGLYRAMGEPRRDRLAPHFCDACFTGDYPIALTDISGGTKQLSLLADVA